MSIESWVNPQNENNDIQKIKTYVWNIITAKIFLDNFFEKYYHNFIDENGNFCQTTFQKCIEIVEKRFAGDNYKIRYSNFEKYSRIITSILQGSENSFPELKESIICDLDAILWENLTTKIENFKNKKTISTVQIWIQSFVEKEFHTLEMMILDAKLSTIRNDFIDKIAQVLKKNHNK